jgi:hypothetical protein
MERRKKPRLGDVVKLILGPLQTLQVHIVLEGAVGLIVDTCGIHIWVRLFAVPWEGHSGLEYVRRDSVEILSYANPQ